jgi:putative tryptophan/tyrosine transport system substrate-binding protein
MKRRTFITLIGGAAASPLAARAQQPAKMKRIGVLMSLDANDPEGQAQLSGFTQGLSELGWMNGSNLRMEVRWGGSDVNQIQTFAKELAATQPDLIVSRQTRLELCASRV